MPTTVLSEWFTITKLVPCSTAEEMFERANAYLKRTRALAHEYVRLPEDEICRCVPICECCKDSYPWGGYEGGG